MKRQLERAAPLVFDLLQGIEANAVQNFDLPLSLLPAFQTIGHQLQGKLGPSAILIAGRGDFNQRLLAQFIGRWLLCCQSTEMLMAQHASKLACRCQSCCWVREGTHPSLMAIDGGGMDGTVETLRERLEELAMAPRQSDFHVVVITRCERMTPEAVQALLKPLEESIWPTYWVLSSENSVTIPQTILSRLKHFCFRPVAASKLRHWAKSLAAEASESTLCAASRLACGAPLAVYEALQVMTIKDRHTHLQRLSQIVQEPEQCWELLTQSTTGSDKVSASQFLWSLTFWSDLIKVSMGYESLIIHADWYDSFQALLLRIHHSRHFKHQHLVALWQLALKAWRDLQHYPYLDSNLLWSNLVARQALVLSRSDLRYPDPGSSMASRQTLCLSLPFDVR